MNKYINSFLKKYGRLPANKEELAKFILFNF